MELGQNRTFSPYSRIPETCAKRRSSYDPTYLLECYFWSLRNVEFSLRTNKRESFQFVLEFSFHCVALTLITFIMVPCLTYFNARLVSRNCSPNSVLSRDLILYVNGLFLGCIDSVAAAAAAAYCILKGRVTRIVGSIGFPFKSGEPYSHLLQYYVPLSMSTHLAFRSALPVLFQH